MRVEYLLKSSLASVEKAHVMNNALVYKKTATNWGFIPNETIRALMTGADGTDYFHDCALEYGANALFEARDRVFQLNASVWELIKGLPVCIALGRANAIKDTWKLSTGEVHGLEANRYVQQYHQEERFDWGAVDDDLVDDGSWDGTGTATIQRDDDDSWHALLSGTCDLEYTLSQAVGNDDEMISFVANMSAGPVYWYFLASSLASIGIKCASNKLYRLHHVAEDFEAYSVGDNLATVNPGNWTLLDGFAKCAAGQYGHIYKNNGQYGVALYAFDEASSPPTDANTPKIYVDVYCPSANNETYIGTIGITDDDTDFADLKVHLYFTNAGNKIQYYQGAALHDTALTYTDDTLHRLGIKFLAGTFYVNLDGGAWQGPYTNNNAWDGAETIQKLRFVGGGASGEGIYFDDISPNWINEWTEVEWTGTGSIDTEGLHVFWAYVDEDSGTYDFYVDGDKIITAGALLEDVNTIDTINVVTESTSSVKIYDVDLSYVAATEKKDLTGYAKVYLGCLDGNDVYHFVTAAGAANTLVARRMDCQDYTNENLTIADIGENDNTSDWERLVATRFGKLMYRVNDTGNGVDYILGNEWNERIYAPVNDAAVTENYSITDDGFLCCTNPTLASSVGPFNMFFFLGFMKATAAFVGHGGAIVDSNDELYWYKKRSDASWEVAKDVDDVTEARVFLSSEDDIDTESMQLVDSESFDGDPWYNFVHFSMNQDPSDHPRISTTGTPVVEGLDNTRQLKLEESDIKIDAGLYRKWGAVTVVFTPVTGTGYHYITLMEGAVNNIEVRVNLATGQVDVYTAAAWADSTLDANLDEENTITITWVVGNTFIVTVNGSDSASINNGNNWTNGMEFVYLNTNTAGDTTYTRYVDAGFHLDEEYRVFGGFVREKQMGASGDIYWLEFSLLGWENEWFKRTFDRVYNFTAQVLMDDAIQTHDYPLTRYHQNNDGAGGPYNGDLYSITPSRVLADIADIEDMFFYMKDSTLVMFVSSPLYGFGNFTITGSGKKRKQVNSVVVVGAWTSEGQVKVTRTSATNGAGQAVIYAPECRTRAEANAVGDAYLARCEITTATVQGKRKDDEYAGKIITLNSTLHGFSDKEFYVVSETDHGDGLVTLELKDAWEQEGLVLADYQRMNNYSEIQPSAANSAADGSRSTIFNTKNAVDQGFIKITPVEPANPTQGMLWADTATNKLKVYIGGAWRTW